MFTSFLFQNQTAITGACIEMSIKSIRRVKATQKVMGGQLTNTVRIDANLHNKLGNMFFRKKILNFICETL